MRDWQEYLKDTDRGATEIDLEDPPGWLDVEAECPVCGIRVGDHDQVRVADASAEVFACLPEATTVWWELPQPPPDGSW